MGSQESSFGGATPEDDNTFGMSLACKLGKQNLPYKHFQGVFDNVPFLMACNGSSRTVCGTKECDCSEQEEFD